MYTNGKSILTFPCTVENTVTKQQFPITISEEEFVRAVKNLPPAPKPSFIDRCIEILS